MFFGDFVEEQRKKKIIIMIMIRGKDLKRTMEPKRKICKSLSALSSIFWAKNLRPWHLGANK